jgi:hypothetical protein
MKKTVEVHILQGPLDYHTWELELKSVLMTKGLWSLCNGEEEPIRHKDEGATFEARMLDYRKRKYMAMGLISRTLQSQHRRLLEKANNSKQLLEAIKAQFYPNNIA